MREDQMRSLVLFGLLSLLLGSTPAMGSNFAFATDGVNPPGPGPLALPHDSGVQSVFIFLKIGPEALSSPPCVTDAPGDEICGFDVMIEIAGGHPIISFTPAGNVKYFQQSTTTIRAVGLDAINPDPTVAQLVGELQLDTQPSEGSVTVSGTVVRADLEPAPVEDEIVAEVPEPDSMLMLIAGILTLSILHSLRSRRDSFSATHAGH
jgi:hypothetical protein